MENKIPDHINECILAFLDHTITSKELHDLHAWVNESETHRAFFKQVQQTWMLSAGRASIEQFDAQTAYDLFQLRLHQNQPKREKRSLTLSRRWFLYLSSAAAVLLLMIGAGFWGGLRYAKGEVMTYTVEAPRTGKLKVDLPDGSVVWLNAESRLHYTNRFGVSDRDLSLEGEGYFNIAKNPKIPLVVQMDQARVKVLGTQFNVTSYENDEEIRVVLVEGRVEFSNPRNERATLMRPNQQLSYNKQSGVATLRNVNTEYANAWINGNVFFNEEKLGVIARVLERTYGVNIHFQNENLKNLIFYGDLVFEPDNIEQVLGVMSATNKFKYTYQKDRKELYIYN